MMSFLDEARDIFEDRVFGSGCDDGVVVIRRKPDAPFCQYMKGAAIETNYGGKGTQMVTNYPVQATTRVSFLFGAGLDTPEKRTAACAIINAVMGFLCLSRISRACEQNDHSPCLSYLLDEIAGSRVFCNGKMPAIREALSGNLIDDPEEADLILVTGDALFTDEGVEITDRFRHQKRIIYIGPETAGIAAVLEDEHWCPFGRA